MKSVPKKAYQTPELVIYGDIREVTQATTNKNNRFDGVKDMTG